MSVIFVCSAGVLRKTEELRDASGVGFMHQSRARTVLPSAQIYGSTTHAARYFKIWLHLLHPVLGIVQL